MKPEGGSCPTLALLALVALAGATLAQTGAADGDWPRNGGDAGATRYSPLGQIDSENLHRLRVAWEWTTVDAPFLAAHENLRATNFEATPLEIGGVLYVSTPLNLAAAIDAETGETLWSFNPETFSTSDRARGGLRFVNRGMAHWPGAERDGERVPPRLLYGTRDGQLIALDATTGEPVGGFGKDGRVDILAGIPRLSNRDAMGFSAVPMVIGDVVVMGSRVSDGALRKTMPPGYVRGFDVVTGELRWQFHSVPLDGELGAETWEEGAAEYSGNTNVWTLLSADLERGLVYLPFGTPTNDFYGGARLGDNLYAESLVCLDARTGERKWHFQAIHHGLWDYDLPAAPVLVDLTVGGREIPAVALVTKHGFTFVFDRITGEPVWPIEERPVPASDLYGERASPTQPFPTRPPPFERQGITVDDLIDFTPELRAEALEILEQYDHGPLFTPPSLRGALLLPSYGGGANWPGAAFDPETRTLFVPSMSRVLVMKMVEPDQSRSDFRYVRSGSQVDGPRGLPLIKPPYGRVTAIDLDRGEIRWTATNGGDGPRDHEAIAHLDLPPLGTATRAAVLATRTLLFVTDGSGRSGSAIGGGNRFRALGKETGEELWTIDLGAHATGPPITYLAGDRQFLVVPLGSDPPKLVALALEATEASR